MLAQAEWIRKGFADHACLWETGIVPWRAIYDHLELADAEDQRDWKGAHGCKEVWTDASGINPKDHRTRKVAWAAVTAEGEVIRGALPGRQQTVFRGELYALLRAVQLTRGEVMVISDCKQAVDSYLV